MELIFATHNQHKTEEAREIAASFILIKNLKDIGCFEEIPETADTLPGNALQKAHYVVEHFHVNCFADDTGLEVEALDGRPGVYVTMEQVLCCVPISSTRIFSDLEWWVMYRYCLAAASDVEEYCTFALSKIFFAAAEMMANLSSRGLNGSEVRIYTSVTGEYKRATFSFIFSKKTAKTSLYERPFRYSCVFASVNR